MRAEPPRNMAFLLGTEGYKGQKKIVQAPGGPTSISLGCDTSSPFEFQRSKYHKDLATKGPSTDLHQTISHFGDNNQRTANPVRANQTSSEFKSTFHTTGFADSNVIVPEKPFQGSQRGSIRKNRQEVSTKITQNTFISSTTDRKPQGAAGLVKKVQEIEISDKKEVTFVQEPVNNRSPRPHEFPSEPRTRSRSQVPEAKNNYTSSNIFGDFSSKPSEAKGRGTGYASQFRTTNDLGESKVRSSGKKIVKPPGGGSNFSFWG